MGHLALQPSLDCQSQDSGVGFITGLSSSTEPNFTSGSILQELLTFADVGLSAAVCGQYEVGTVQLYPSPPLPSGIGCPSPQCCNRNSVLGSRLGLLTVCRTGGHRSWGGLQIHWWSRGGLCPGTGLVLWAQRHQQGGFEGMQMSIWQRGLWKRSTVLEILLFISFLVKLD